MKKVIERQLLLYGFLPLLIVLEELHKTERYEICEVILQVIHEANERLGLDLPTVYNEQAIINMKIDFMVNFGLSGDIAHANSTYYTEEVMKAINAHKQ